MATLRARRLLRPAGFDELGLRRAISDRILPFLVAACLSLPLEDIRMDAHPPKVVSVGLPFVMVELASRDALRRARANSAAHEELLPPIGAEGVYAYTRDADAGCDIQARMFAPLDAVVEDPATGSATAVAVALLAGRFVVRPLFRSLAATNNREAFTVVALFALVGLGAGALRGGRASR